jgi:hypothetical protein
MRSVAALAALLAVLLTAVLPCHRCIPVGSEGRAALVSLGSHAHEGHGEHRGCGHSHAPGRECGDDSKPTEPCCVHEPGDPSAAPSRYAIDLPPSVEVGSVAFEAPPSASSVFAAPAWRPPDRRAPTETVVLLR